MLKIIAAQQEFQLAIVSPTPVFGDSSEVSNSAQYLEGNEQASMGCQQDTHNE